MKETTSPPAPTFVEALGFWLRLGFLSFGGPAGQIAIMHDYLVDKKPYAGFMAGYSAFGSSLSAATLGLAATVWYTFLPSFLFIFAGAPLIERTQANPAVKSVLQYATAAVAGVILSLCLYLGQAVIAPYPPDINWLALAWLLISLAALQVFKVHLLVWIAMSMAAGLIRYSFLG